MKILAVDLGSARTGIAISDAREMLASPVGTIEEWDLARLAQRVAAIAAEQNAQRLVVGHHRNMDGSCGESAKRAEAFAQTLAQLTGLPTDLWDERMTTVSAIGYLNQTDVRGKKRKQVVDTVAATIILEDYLQSRRLRGVDPMDTK
jgi:putative Holliday junction resolvase